MEGRMKIQTHLFMVFRQQERKSISDPLWVLNSAHEEMKPALAVYESLDCKHKLAVEWSFLDGIKLVKADFNQTEWIDWEHVSYLALPHADDIAWDVTVAAIEYFKDGFLFKS
jgi:hypothetical protein